MQLRSIAELRAIVGDDGKDWSDEELLAADAEAAVFADLIVATRIDQLRPAEARLREAAHRATEEIRLAPRRARYDREARRRAERRSA